MLDVLKPLKPNRAETRVHARKLPTGTQLARCHNDRQDGKREHQFSWNGKMWFCSVCLNRTLLPISNCAVPSCPGPPTFKGLFQNLKGHSLLLAGMQEGGVILYCSLCYFYASPHPRKLNAPCKGFPSVEGVCMQFYLSRRKPPTSRVRLFKPTPIPACLLRST